MAQNTPANDDDEQLPGTQIALGEAFHLLSSPRRRRVLDLLGKLDGDSLSDLADLVAAAEYGPGYDSTDRKRVYISLYQSHVPELDSYDVVDYDSETKRVRRGPRFDDLKDALDAVRATGDDGDGDTNTQGVVEGVTSLVASGPTG